MWVPAYRWSLSWDAPALEQPENGVQMDTAQESLEAVIHPFPDEEP